MTYSKPKVTIDLDEYDELKSKSKDLRKDIIDDDEISIIIFEMSRCIMNQGISFEVAVNSILNQTGIEVVKVSNDTQLNMKFQFTRIHNNG